LAGSLKNEASVSGSEVDDHALAMGGDQVLKGASIELVKAFAAYYL
jgi:hypothetical protein